MDQCGTGSTQEGGKTSDMSENLLTGMYCMRRSRGSRPDCQKTALTLFFLILDLFYTFTVVYQLFISKKTISFQGFRGSPTFFRVGGGGGGGGGGAEIYLQIWTYGSWDSLLPISMGPTANL